MNRLCRAYVFQLMKLLKNVILIGKLVVLFVVRQQIDDTQQLFHYAQSHYMILPGSVVMKEMTNGEKKYEAV